MGVRAGFGAVAGPPEIRLLVLMRAESGNIVDTSTPTALLLDAEFVAVHALGAQIEPDERREGALRRQPQRRVRWRQEFIGAGRNRAPRR